MKREAMKIRGAFSRLFSIKRCSLPRALFFISLLSLLSCLIFLYRVMDPNSRVPKAHPLEPNVRCLTKNKGPEIFNPHNHRNEKRIRFAHRALLITENVNSKGSQKIRNFLNSLRIDVKSEHKLKTLPPLSNKRSGRFAVIIFEDYNSYFTMDKWNRQLIDKYCRDYHVGIISFVTPLTEDSVGFSNVNGYHLTLQYNLMLEDFKLEANSKLWRVTKPHDIWKGILTDKWAVFHCNHSSYQPLAYSRLSPKFFEFDSGDHADLSFKFVTAVYDSGNIDGIRRIILGSTLDFWLLKMIMMDSMSYLSFGKLQLTLDRYIQVDVDDIFVGKEGIRMKVPDVEAMIQTQARLQKVIDGFVFNLGYSGGFYLYGSEEEDAGDRALIGYSHKFRWFPHMYRHEQPHRFESTVVEGSMIKNKQFAEDHGIAVNSHYAIAPHHSGVYPVHEPLYTLWRRVWGTKITSTEEYPKLLPAWKRRGFIHRGIMVLPRQTCGLFTTILYHSDFRGGLPQLDKSIQGGEIFQTILTTPINIFMTHLSNYGSDRLANYVFESVVSFVNCWTNLNLLYLPPVELGVKYFEMYPQDKDPLWTNPCDYNRHQVIWSAKKSCNKLPDFVVVGPQKTGSTALHSFLSQHPSLVSNYNSPTTFEEIQFFNTNNYYYGLTWYMDFFPDVKDSNTTLLFEKSANYFESEVVPKRVAHLLPKAKIIILLMDPALRAYSWYQHMRLHNDPMATNYTFYEVISSSDMASFDLRNLRNRCLSPGLYAQHIIKWLDFFPSKQIHIVHSDELRTDPVTVMHFVQKFLHVQPYINYSEYLRFDAEKGFFCPILNEKQNKCLGKSKGHNYPPMDKEAEHHLQLFYRKHNINLSKLLPTLGSDIPDWLHLELKEADLLKH